MAAGSDVVLTIDTLAEDLKISKSMLYKLVHNSRLPSQKDGKRWRFHKSALDNLLRQHPEHKEHARVTDKK